jgi:hypothetical protein
MSIACPGWFIVIIEAQQGRRFVLIGHAWDCPALLIFEPTFRFALPGLGVLRTHCTVRAVVQDRCGLDLAQFSPCCQH